MKNSSFRTLVIVGALVAVVELGFIDQPGSAASAQSIAETAAPVPPATTSAPPPTTPPAPAKSATAPAAQAPVEAAKPSADLLKKARQGGYHMKVRNGTALFCREEAPLGTRFVRERCIDENQLVETLEAQQLQRDQLNQAACTRGLACGGSK